MADTASLRQKLTDAAEAAAQAAIDCATDAADPEKGPSSAGRARECATAARELCTALSVLPEAE